MASLDAKPYPPSYILNGHMCDVTSVAFACVFAIPTDDKSTTASCSSFARNILISGDQSGEVRVWDLRVRRPLVCFNCNPSSSGSATAKVPQSQTSQLRSSSGVLSTKLFLCHVQEPFAFRAFVLTQLRNRRVLIVQSLIRSLDREVSLTKMFEIQIEQFGFCCFAAFQPRGSSNLLLALPGDGDGNVELHELVIATLSTDCVHVEQNPSRTVSCAIGFKCGQAMYHEFWPYHAEHHTVLFLLIAFESGHVAVCDVESMVNIVVVRAFPEPALCTTHYFDAASSELSLFAASAEGTLQCYKASIHPMHLQEQNRPTCSASCEAVLSWECKLPLGVSQIALRPSDSCRMLAIAGWDHRIRLFDARTAAVVSVLQHHRGQVFGLSFAPCQTSCRDDIVASCSADRSIAVWKL